MRELEITVSSLLRYLVKKKGCQKILSLLNTSLIDIYKYKFFTLHTSDYSSNLLNIHVLIILDPCTVSDSVRKELMLMLF